MRCIQTNQECTHNVRIEGRKNRADNNIDNNNNNNNNNNNKIMIIIPFEPFKLHQRGLPGLEKCLYFWMSLLLNFTLHRYLDSQPHHKHNVVRDFYDRGARGQTAAAAAAAVATWTAEGDPCGEDGASGPSSPSSPPLGRVSLSHAVQMSWLACVQTADISQIGGPARKS